MQKSLLFSLLFFSIQIIAPPSPAKPIRKTAKPPSWQTTTIHALNFIEQTLKENHPAWAGESAPEWDNRLKQTKQLVQQKLTLVKDLDSYQKLLSWFTCKLGEHQTSVSFETASAGKETATWPGFLITYLPHIKRFCLIKEEEFSDGQKGCAHCYREATYIDGTNVKTWLEKNVIPFYHAGDLDAAAYKACAPYAFITRSSSFTETPKNIDEAVVGLPLKGPLKYYQSSAVTLSQKAISPQDLKDRITTAQKMQSEFGWVVSKNAFFAMFNDRAYVYLPTFDPETIEEKNSLEEVITKLPSARSCKEIVFDVRTNTGGKRSYVKKILSAWAGANQSYEYTPIKRMDWCVSPGNIAYLEATEREALASRLAEALKKGERLFEEIPYRNKRAFFAPQKTDCNIKIIIDGYNQGVVCEFISCVKACSRMFGPVTLAGQTTSSKGNYEQVRTENFGKGSRAFTLHFPISLNKTYGLTNDRYTPDDVWEDEEGYPLCQFPKDEAGLTRLLWPQIEKKEEPSETASSDISTKPAELPSWQECARADIESIKKVLQENHPGAVDEGPNDIKQWIAGSKKQLAKMIPLVTDEASYKALLSWYISGFHDEITSISFSSDRRVPGSNLIKTPPIFEWPGILISYDPASKSFRPTPNGYNLTGCLYHIGYRIIKIDDLDPRSWIEKNIIPFESRAKLGIESTYVNMAPWALVWKNNPFAEKPKTITVHSMMMKKYLIIRDGKAVPAHLGTETLTLNWKPITTRELITKREVLKTPAHDNMAHILFFEKTEDSSHPYDVYVKIPSFNGENSEIAESLNHVAEKLNAHMKYDWGKNEFIATQKSTINIIFDLRGNGGENSLATTKIINSVGGESLEQWRLIRNPFYEVWWRATPTNASCLSKTRCESLSEREKTEVENLTKSVQRSLDAGEQFFKEKASLFCNKMGRYTYHANIDIITDAECGGSTLDFIDRIKRLGLGNVRLIGQPTAPYSMYMHPCNTYMRSARRQSITVTYPIAIRKDLSSQHNQPYTPDHILSDYLMHPRPLEETNAFLEEITNALHPQTTSIEKSEAAL